MYHLFILRTNLHLINSDLIYCGSKNENGNLQTFRYTQNQRRLATRLKKYNKIIDKINKETKIENKSIKEIETELSLLNSKTCDPNPNPKSPKH